jgi:hypothetical protein
MLPGTDRMVRIDHGVEAVAQSRASAVRVTVRFRGCWW